MRRRSVSYLLQVDPVRCDGFGHCAELAPELVTLDEWGYPIIQATPIQRSNREVLNSARLAVRGCPRAALKLCTVTTTS
jgi:ferredoxin